MSEIRSPELEAKIAAITTALGAAMAKWQDVEGNIFLLFVALSRSGPLPNACSVIYETLVHLESKVTAVDALVQFRITDDQLMSQWTTLHNRIRRKTKIRNKVAHWRIWYDTDRPQSPPFLAPHLHRHLRDVKDFGKSSGGAMIAEDLLAHAKTFGILAIEVRAFIDAYVQTTSREKSA